MDLLLENNDMLVYFIKFIKINYNRIESNLILYNLSKTNFILRNEIMKNNHSRELTICYVDNYLVNKVTEEYMTINRLNVILENEYNNKKKYDFLNNLFTKDINLKNLHINANQKTIHSRWCFHCSRNNENLNEIISFYKKNSFYNENDNLSDNLTLLEYEKNYHLFNNFKFCKSCIECECIYDLSIFLSKYEYIHLIDLKKHYNIQNMSFNKILDEINNNKNQLNYLQKKILNLKYRSDLLTNLGNDKKIYINFKKKIIHDKNCRCIKKINSEENNVYLSGFLNKLNFDNNNQEISIKMSLYNYLNNYNYFKDFSICKYSRKCKLLNKFFDKEINNINILINNNL